ncbi:MAG: hypothetical protein M0042_05245 [Nitrospiraceae bacterium]|nr:hypothetical protein [Nitrospiraceae bacterium]
MRRTSQKVTVNAALVLSGPRKNRTGMRGRGARKTVICPFTLEAVRDCDMRLRTPRSLCRFTLDVCRAGSA